MKISEEKKEKISEQVLAFLYSISPKPEFTSSIAKEVARDEEFIKSLLTDLKKKGLVVDIRKNQDGKQYTKRTRCALSDGAYGAYSTNQKAEL